MKTTAVKISIDESGDVSGECMMPEKPIAVLVLAHGAGAGMHHPFMKVLSAALSENGIATLRYNFPYMEVKKKRPDVPAVAHRAVEAAISKAAELFPGLPVFAGGKSFGGRMTSQYESKEGALGVQGLIFVGFPLHPAGKPGVERAAHLTKVNIPMLFLQGTRDTLAQWDLIKQVCTSLPVATLSTWEGADHSFKVPGKNLIPELALAISQWISLQLSAGRR